MLPISGCEGDKGRYQLTITGQGDGFFMLDTKTGELYIQVIGQEDGRWVRWTGRASEAYPNREAWREAAKKK